MLHRLKEGDRDAFDTLFRHYYPRLMAYSLSFLAEEEAEDVVQDVFLYLWEHRSTLYAGEGFQAYLFRAAHSRCMDCLRKVRSAEEYRSALYDTYLQESVALMEHKDGPIENLSRRDFYARLRELLDQLPEQRRKVFILAYVHEMKTKEIAEALHIPPRTVESHLYLSLKFLRKHFSAADFDSFRLYPLLLLTFPEQIL